MINVPKLSDLYDSILADLQNEFGVQIPVWGKSFLRAFAAVQAAKLKLYYLAIGKLQKNIFVDTADPESAGGTLERFGRVKIGRNPFPATQGKYSITVTGFVGSTIPANTTWKSDDGATNPGMLYALDSAHIMATASDTIEIRALTSGTAARLNIGDTLTATSPIIGVDATVAVAAETLIPNEAETIEDYRNVVVQSYRLLPQGGASADYRLWGYDASGVEEIYPYAASGAPNEVNVYVEATIPNSADGMGTPTATILSDVAAVIESDPDTGRGRRPLGVFQVNVLPVTINKISIEIDGYQNLTPEKQTIIQNTLKELVDSVRPFIAGADVLADKNDNLSINKFINSIINAIPDSLFDNVVMTVQVGANTPTIENIRVFDNGNIPFLTTITYA